MNILFVCYGNICRSPMAEGLAKKELGAKANVESAGIAPVSDRPSEEAVWIMKTLYSIDISGHRSRPVSAVTFNHFDYVIALDYSIYGRLKAGNQIPEEKLFGWDIEDPFGEGLGAYQEAARRIEERLRQFLHTIGVE
jgi:protein-tyrosine phosphatase